MSYRDEREALRQRVAELEQDLEEAKAELAGRSPDPVGEVNPLLGAPSKVVIERELPDVDDDAIAAMVARLRREIGETGRLERIGSSVAWVATGRTGRFVEMTIERTKRGTTLRLTEPLQNLVGGLFGGLLGGLGGGGVIIPMIPMFFGNPEYLFATIPAWLGAVYLGTRTLYAQIANKRHASASALADQLVTIAHEETEGSQPAVRARVETDDEEGFEEAFEEPDAEQAREA